MASRFPLCDCSPADDSPLVVVPSIVLGSVSLWACHVCDRLVRRQLPQPAPRGAGAAGDETR